MDLQGDELRLERDLYRRLLELGGKEDPGPFLEEALALIVEATRARKGYLGLFGDGAEGARWWMSSGFSDDEVRSVRQRISSGIIAEAMATGAAVQTESAQADPRYKGQQSVVLNAIDAVLCVPVTVGEQAIGVLYLQERVLPGPFAPADRERAELFARHLAPLADRLRLVQDGHGAVDATRPVRARLRLDGLVGRSQALAEVFAQIESAARFAVPVLLHGPSGTGKTAFARAIHDNGPRAGRPFLELNCAAIPEGLFESELFGALPGSHSTATRKVIGKIAAAQGGTLFLDEVGELPPAVQAKLLQFLQSKEYFPLGGTQAEKANVRVIAATNADLRDAVERKAFREDLYYRLNVLAIRVPSLAERRDDIALLAQHFCDAACASYDLDRLALAPSAVVAVEEAEWPGNVRQLAHQVEAATIRAAMETAAAVERRHVFPDAAPGEPEAEKAQLTYQEATRRFQARLLAETLDAAQWNISETARRLDLTRTHVRHLIQAFGLKPR